MKAKTIQSIINEKFDYWVRSIKDESVQNLVKDNTILTGGSIASMLLNEEVNDFDFYFRNKETTLAVANYYVDKFKQNPPSKFLRKNPDGSSIEIPITVDEYDGRIKIVVKSSGIASEKGSDDYQYFELSDDAEAAEEYVNQITSVLSDGANPDSFPESKVTLSSFINEQLQYYKTPPKKKPTYRPLFLTTNAITLSDGIQLVIRFYGNPETIHENYDFVHCTNYWCSWTRELVLNKEALECILSKELKYVGSKYPLASIFRTRKFIRRGWTITAGQMLKIMMQINDLDLDNVSILEDQLVGVDVAYFMEIIDLLKKNSTDNKVDRTYLISIIDKIF